MGRGGRRCAAGACDNCSLGDNKRLHLFPSDEKIREKWTKQVRTYRPNFSPTPHSHLCQDHFVSTDYNITDVQAAFYKENGIKYNRYLKKDAVPSIFWKQNDEIPLTDSSESTPLAKLNLQTPVRGAYLKREHQRVLAEALSPEIPSQSQDAANQLKKSKMSPLTPVTPKSTAAKANTPTTMPNKRKRVLHKVQKSFSSIGVQVCHTDTEFASQCTTVNNYSQTIQPPKIILCNTSSQCNPVNPVSHVSQLIAKDPQFSSTPINSPYHRPNLPEINIESIERDEDSVFNKRIMGNMPTDRDDSDLESEGEMPPYDYEDETYNPSDNEEEEENEEEMCNVSTIDEMIDIDASKPIHKQEKFIVFGSALFSLFPTICPSSDCFETVTRSTSTWGTALKVVVSCKKCGYHNEWNSMPNIGRYKACNILLSAASLYTGSSITKVLRVFDILGCHTISRSTFFNHQRDFLIPSVRQLWSNHQNTLLNGVSKIMVGGDMRCDSPGHCAKFGSYSFVDLKRNKVVEMNMIQSNEVTSSNAMELEGFKRGLSTFAERGCTVDYLVTDRHMGVRKEVRENCKGIKHRMDLWHIEKSITKKLVAAGNKKGRELILKWVPSIRNHLYYSAITTTDENNDMIEAKWMSVNNHILNRHNNHGGLFPKCGHPSLRGKVRKKKWFEAGTDAYETISTIISNKRLVKDIGQVSVKYQTSSIEAYHSVVNHFAPKQMSYSYMGMLARLLLAAIHFNENSQRAPTGMYKLKYPKAKKGQHTVVKVIADCTYGYIDDLMAEMVPLVEDNIKSMNNPKTPVPAIPPPLSSKCEKIDKKTAVEQFRSRYK